MKRIVLALAALACLLVADAAQAWQPVVAVRARRARVFLPRRAPVFIPVEAPVFVPARRPVFLPARQPDVIFLNGVPYIVR